MTSGTITAAAAGSWKLGDLTVNRIGFGAMRLSQNGTAFGADATPSDRGRAITVLRRAVEFGVNHIDTAIDSDSAEVLAVAEAHRATTAQVRLAWTLQQGAHVLAIPGTGNPDHLVENVAAGALRLSQDDLTLLRSLHERGYEPCG